MPASQNSVTPIKRVARSSLESRIKKLEQDRDVLAWLHAEMAFKLKMAAAKQFLSNPQIQAALQQRIASAMEG